MKLGEFLKSQNIFKLTEETIAQICRFHELLKEENRVQNLTKLISDEDFYYGHCVDVLFLNKEIDIEYPAFDLGSGAGIPGLLSCIINKNAWFLCESEKRKADFLRKVTKQLKLEGTITITHERAEKSAKELNPKTIVSRAVGKTEKIYNLIKNCSTWNKIVLFKGNNWKNEETPKKLKIKDIKKYKNQEKERFLVSYYREK